MVVVTEEHYEQPVEGFTRALAVVADDVADDVSRAAANVLEFPSLPRCVPPTERGPYPSSPIAMSSLLEAYKQLCK